MGIYAKSKYNCPGVAQDSRDMDAVNDAPPAVGFVHFVIAAVAEHFARKGDHSQYGMAAYPGSCRPAGKNIFNSQTAMV